MGFCYKCSIIIVILAISIPIIPIIFNILDQREFNRQTSAEEAAKGNDLNNKIIIVTGSSSGIGIPTAKVLAQNGAIVIMACRNIEKANKIRQEILSSINKTIDNQHLVVMKLDLGNLQSIDNFVNEFKSKYTSLNILINNAGVGGIPTYKTTDNGVELNFGVNHLGHFYLTQKLTDLLSKTSGISRVINVASISAYFHAPSNIKEWLISNDNLRDKTQYEAFLYYGVSKACNIIYSREYNKRYGKGNNGIYSISLHPGWINTNIASDQWFASEILTPLGDMLGFTKTLSQGAATSIRLASMNDNEFIKYGGKYFQDCNQKDLWRNDLIQDGENSDELGKLLWDLSLQTLKEKGFTL